MKLVIAITAFIFCYNCIAQGVDYDNIYTPPSPNASGLVKYANVPVSLYTGTPIIDLPITQLKGRELSVPISVSYHASGNKVQDLASWIGLGWSLNAGGVISRTVRGLPDEDANGFCGVNNVGEKVYQAPDKDFVNKISNGIWDGEPDLFYFNFLGQKGMFVLDETGQPVSLPYSNIKIQPAICPAGLGKWILTDADGIQYTFGGDTNSKETTASKITGSSTTYTYVSSWYLSEIKSQTGELVQFSYTTGGSISYKFYTQINRKAVRNWGMSSSCTDATQQGTTTVKDIEIAIANPRYLAQISTTQGRLVFVNKPGREDLNGALSLSQIQVFSNVNNALVTSFKFASSYFQSDNCSTSLCKRLKLNEILESVNGVSVSLYKFDYNSTNLPSRDSHQIDHWGYYNSNSYSSKIPEFNDTQTPCPAFHAGADRSTDSTRSKANILTKIYLATGGSKEFIYSANTYTDSNGVQKIAGGIRTRAIESCAEPGNCMTERFYYKKFSNSLQSSGLLLEEPKYDLRRTEGQYVVSPQGAYAYGTDYLIRQSQSYTTLFDLNGYHIGYSNVVTRMSGNGYSRHYFTDLNSKPDGDPSQFRYEILNTGNGSTTGQMGDPIDSKIYPFTPNTSKLWERGLLTRKEIFSEEGKLLLLERFKYKFDNAIVKSVKAAKAGRASYNYFGNYYNVGNYYSESRPYTKEKLITTNYDQNSAISDTTKKVVLVNEYLMNTSTLLPVQITSYNDFQPSSKDVIKYKYASDLNYTYNWQDCMAQMQSCYTNCTSNCSSCYTQYQACMANNDPLPDIYSEAILLMNQNHQLLAPVEIQSLSQENGILNLVSSTIYKYKKYGAFVKPQSVWQVKSIPSSPSPYQGVQINSSTGVFETDGRAKLITSFDSYDVANGNLLQSTDNAGITQAYEWSPDYNSSLITKLRVNPGANERESKFEFKQLVGLTKSTDFNSRNTTYEYDQLNRLKLTRNHDQKILTTSKSRNVMEGFQARIGISGFTAVNGSVVFEDLTEGAQPGSSSYSWNFGDGTQSIGVSTVSHVYAIPGNYTVTLTKSNPEYGNASASSTVTILPAPSISICIDGPEGGDLCGINPMSYGSCTSTNIYYYSPTVFNAQVSDGCGAYTYYWSYNTGYGWIPFGSSTSSVNAPFSGAGTFEVKCRVVDVCGNEVTTTTDYLSFYYSNSNCPQY